MGMKNTFIVVATIVFLLVGGLYVANSYISSEQRAPVVSDHRNTEFMIEGKLVRLVDGVAETEVAQGSAGRITTRYVGHELRTDLDDDGREDVVLLVTQEMGGSGTFFYAVAALNTAEGYRGSDGYLLGDRIAPQTIHESPNPRHVNVIVVNYAERNPGEPMTTPPSAGKSAWLKLDVERMQWGIVVPDFEGESR